MGFNLAGTACLVHPAATVGRSDRFIPSNARRTDEGAESEVHICTYAIQGYGIGHITQVSDWVTVHKPKRSVHPIKKRWQTVPIGNHQSDTIVNLRGLRALRLHGCPFPSGPDIEDAEVLGGVRASERNTSILVYPQLLICTFKRLKLDCWDPRLVKRSRTGRGEPSWVAHWTWKIRGDLG